MASDARCACHWSEHVGPFKPSHCKVKQNGHSFFFFLLPNLRSSVSYSSSFTLEGCQTQNNCVYVTVDLEKVKRLFWVEGQDAIQPLVHI